MERVSGYQRGTDFEMLHHAVLKPNLDSPMVDSTAGGKGCMAGMAHTDLVVPVTDCLVHCLPFRHLVAALIPSAEVHKLAGDSTDYWGLLVHFLQSQRRIVELRQPAWEACKSHPGLVHWLLRGLAVLYQFDDVRDVGNMVRLDSDRIGDQKVLCRSVADLVLGLDSGSWCSRFRFQKKMMQEFHKNLDFLLFDVNASTVFNRLNLTAGKLVPFIVKR